MVLDSKKGIISQDVDDISALYDGMMKGYNCQELVSFSELKEESYYLKLYAPGYDNNGVAEISANCI